MALTQVDARRAPLDLSRHLRLRAIRTKWRPFRRAARYTPPPSTKRSETWSDDSYETSWPRVRASSMRTGESTRRSTAEWVSSGSWEFGMTRVGAAAGWTGRSARSCSKSWASRTTPASPWGSASRPTWRHRRCTSSAPTICASACWFRRSAERWWARSRSPSPTRAPTSPESRPVRCVMATTG